jgi:UDP-N-acetylmuramate dehydrogenase
MDILPLAPVGPKTTMRIGGQARWYAEPKTREDVEQAVAFAKEKNVPLLVLGGGSNTVFADGVIEALVLRIKADASQIDGDRVTVQGGKILASLINELAAADLDLSALTGIPGSVGGAVFGNAGQGAGGTWLDTYVESVTAYIDGQWKTFGKDECNFRYRESWFKDHAREHPLSPPIVWEATLRLPRRPGAEVKAEVQRLIKKRIETQPHLRTAGSCFKSMPDGTPAWKLIDAAGLRGTKIGGAQIAEKHANFLLNVEKASYADLKALVQKAKDTVTEPLHVEMRFIENDGKTAF